MSSEAFDRDSAAASDVLAEKASLLLDQQLDLAIGVSGQVTVDTAEVIYNLACAYRELSKED